MAEKEMELKKDMECAKELCKKFEDIIKSEMAKGTEQIDAHELGEVVDMMKDCAEIVEKKAKAAYYCSVVKAMEDSKEEDEMMDRMIALDERRGYNSNRYANGQYAPKGRGSRRGYEDDEMMYPVESRGNMYYGTPRRYTDRPWTDMRYDDRRMMGYDGGSSSGSMNGSYGSNTGGNSNGGSGNSSMGYSESRFDRARRGYEETKEMHKSNSTEDKEERMRSLENLWKEIENVTNTLSKDMSPEERNLSKNKLSTMATKM